MSGVVENGDFASQKHNPVNAHSLLLGNTEADSYRPGTRPIDKHTPAKHRRQILYTIIFDTRKHSLRHG